MEPFASACRVGEFIHVVASTKTSTLENSETIEGIKITFNTFKFELLY
jgi:hypothetical protein